MGRPGGGIMALRGHANIQGATDIPTLYDLLPGYLPMPSAQRDEQTLADVSDKHQATGWWANTPKYVISLLKAYYGDAAHAGERLLLRLSAAVDRRPFGAADEICDEGRQRQRLLRHREKSGRIRTERRTRARRAGTSEWMVVNVDTYETKRRRSGGARAPIRRRSAPKCFFLPAATMLEKDGTMVNTNRMLQWHDKAVEARRASPRATLVFLPASASGSKTLYADSTDPKDRPILDLTWDYDTTTSTNARTANRRHSKCCKRSTATTTGNRASKSRMFADLKDDGIDRMRRLDLLRRVSRQGDEPRAQPRQRRSGHRRSTGASRGRRTGACSTIALRPIPTGSRGANARNTCSGTRRRSEWTGPDVPDFTRRRRRNTPAQPGATASTRIPAAIRSSCSPTGAAQLFVGERPQRRTAARALRTAGIRRAQSRCTRSRAIPSLREWDRDDNRYNGPSTATFPTCSRPIG